MDEVVDLKKVEDERGFLVEFLKSQELLKKKFQQIYLVTLKCGVIRGNHYHKKKSEWMGCVTGKIKVKLKNIKTGEEKEIILDPDKEAIFQRLLIKPYVLHTFENLSNSTSALVIYSDHVYDPQKSDTYKS